MARSSKIEPVNILLYRKAWGPLTRGVDNVEKDSQQQQKKKKTNAKKKKGRKKKANK
jgi:hypothetical protein